jgi:hypothetical protein
MKSKLSPFSLASIGLLFALVACGNKSDMPEANPPVKVRAGEVDKAPEIVGNLTLIAGNNDEKINTLGSSSASAIGIPASHLGKCDSTDGMGAEARFCSPRGLAADQLGNLYVGDGKSGVLRKINSDGLVVTLAGKAKRQSYAPGENHYSDGVGSSAIFTSPSGVVTDRKGNIYLCDTGNHVIRKIALDGAVTTIAGTPKIQGLQDGEEKKAKFFEPTELNIDGTGNLFVLDFSNDAVRKIAPNGMVSTLVTFSDRLPNEAPFDDLQGMTIDSSGNLYVIDGAKILRVNSSGQIFVLGDYSETDIDEAGKSTLYKPMGIVADDKGNIYYSIHSVLRKINSQGTVIAKVVMKNFKTSRIGDSTELYFPHSLVFISPNTIAMISGSEIFNLALQ